MKKTSTTSPKNKYIAMYESFKQQKLIYKSKVIVKTKPGIEIKDLSPEANVYINTRYKL